MSFSSVFSLSTDLCFIFVFSANRNDSSSLSRSYSTDFSSAASGFSVGETASGPDQSGKKSFEAQKNTTKKEARR